MRPKNCSPSTWWRSLAVQAVGPFRSSVRALVSDGTIQNLFETASASMPVKRTSFTRCACRKSNPDILVVQPAENWAAKNVPGPLDGARDRRILLQGQMRTDLVVVFHVRQQYVMEMPLAEHNNMV